MDRRFMAALLCVCVGAVCLITNTAHAQDEKGLLGIGLLVGEPTGISAKYYLGDENDQAIDVAIGGTFIKSGYHIHADYLIHPFTLESTDTFVLPFYTGLGLRLLYEVPRGINNNAFHTGTRAVVGVLFDFRNVPLDVFTEIAGILDYRFSQADDDNGFRVRINAGAGVRYYF